MPRAALPQHLDWVNLLDTFPGKARHGDAFPRARARERARMFPLAPVTVLLGRHVARAFGLESPYLAWQEVRGCRVAVLPHPSGVNQWWNTAAHRATFRAFMRTLLRLDNGLERSQ
jgi:hypothetical protein